MYPDLAVTQPPSWAPHISADIPLCLGENSVSLLRAGPGGGARGFHCLTGWRQSNPAWPAVHCSLQPHCSYW